jgi:integrase
MVTKRTKVEAVAARPGTEGEKQAALAALQRMPAAVPERKRLTDASVKTLPPPTKGNRVQYDAPDRNGNNYTRGFGLRITAAGHRSFVLNYRAKNGREGRYTIGSPPDWTLTAARERAKELKRLIDGGADPAKDEREKRTGDNVNKLCDEFIATHVSKKREATRKEYIAILDKYVRPTLGATKVADVRHVDVDRLHRKVSAHAPYRANRMLAVLSKAFNLAIKWNLRSDNPAKFVERNDEQPRERYLQDEELARLHRALDAHSNQPVANVVRLLLLTGARLGETLAARWDAFDLRGGTWTKPSFHTKQKRVHRIPLSGEAVRLLKTMTAAAHDAMLFPDLDKDVMERHWRRIRAAADLDDVRLHDMRHSYASILAGGGQSLPIIGALLGHTQSATTHRYAHLLDAPLRQATEQAGAVLAGRRQSAPGRHPGGEEDRRADSS